MRVRVQVGDIKGLELVVQRGGAEAGRCKVVLQGDREGRARLHTNRRTDDVPVIEARALLDAWTSVHRLGDRERDGAGGIHDGKLDVRTHRIGGDGKRGSQKKWREHPYGNRGA